MGGETLAGRLSRLGSSGHVKALQPPNTGGWSVAAVVDYASVERQRDLLYATLLDLGEIAKTDPERLPVAIAQAIRDHDQTDPPGDEEPLDG